MANRKKWEVSEFGWDGISGVYCVYTYDILKRTNRLMYIGSSKNIGKRIHNDNHPYQQLLKENKCVFLKFKQICNPCEYSKLETSLINKLRPEMNIIKYDYGTR